MRAIVRAVGTTNLLFLLALGCLLFAVGQLAGMWWAVLTASPVLGYAGYLNHQAELAAQRIERIERPERQAAVAERPKR